MAVIPASQSIHLTAFECDMSLLKPVEKYHFEDDPSTFVMRTGFLPPTMMQSLEPTPFTFFPGSYALARLLAQESHFSVDTYSLLYVDAAAEDKVDASMRDEALARLHSLHRAYYDLSPLTFCKAVCLTDTFITRVKVKPKYMMCVAAACYYIASKFETCKQPRPTFDSLVRLSRCGGSATDLVRMVDIILTKLGSSTVTTIGATSATVLNFLQIFLNANAYPSDLSHDVAPLPTFLLRQLEMALCSTTSACFRPSCLALALLSAYKHNPPAMELEESADAATTYKVLQLLRLSDLYNLANFCKVGWLDVDMCSRTLSDSGIISSYSVSPIRLSPITASPLVWNLSRRTRLSLSGSAPPTLNTITEWNEEE